MKHFDIKILKLFYSFIIVFITFYPINIKAQLATGKVLLQNEKIDPKNSQALEWLKNAITSFMKEKELSKIDSARIFLIEAYYRLGLHYQRYTNNPVAARKYFILVINTTPISAGYYPFRFLARHEFASLSNENVRLLLTDLNNIIRFPPKYDSTFNQAYIGIWKYISQNHFSVVQLCELYDNGLQRLPQFKQWNYQKYLAGYCQACVALRRKEFDRAIQHLYPVLLTDYSFLKEESHKLYHRLLFKKADTLISNDEYYTASDTLRKLFGCNVNYTDSIISQLNNDNIDWQDGLLLIKAYLDNNKLPNFIRHWVDDRTHDTSKTNRNEAQFILLLKSSISDSLSIKRKFRAILKDDSKFQLPYLNTKNFLPSWRVLAKTCYEINQDGKNCVPEINQLGMDICDSILVHHSEDPITLQLKINLENQCESKKGYFIFIILGLILGIRIIIWIWEYIKYELISLPILNDCVEFYNKNNTITYNLNKKCNDLFELIKKCKKFNVKIKNKENKNILFDELEYNNIIKKIKNILVNTKEGIIYLKKFDRIPLEEKLEIIFNNFPNLDASDKRFLQFYFKLYDGDFIWKRHFIRICRGRLIIKLKLKN